MNKLTEKISLTAEISAGEAGKRLDQALALVFPTHSRSRLKAWIEQGAVTVNNTVKRPRDRVMQGDTVAIEACLKAAVDWVGEPLPLDIFYEDASLLVVHKPSSWVVHPGAGNSTGTLVNALLHYLPGLSEIPRAGIVHRLDKDTTGLMVVAKTRETHARLVSQLAARKVQRLYEAVVGGVLLSGGTINAPIGRHPHDRLRMAVVESGKPAITHYRVLERLRAYTHLKVQLETGRTHQIRVHMAYRHHPLVGDKVYGGRLRLPPCTPERVQQYLRNFPRQALHACALCLLHPITQKEMNWEAPLPQDMQQLLSVLREDTIDA